MERLEILNAGGYWDKNQNYIDTPEKEAVAVLKALEKRLNVNRRTENFIWVYDAIVKLIEEKH